MVFSIGKPATWSTTICGYTLYNLGMSYHVWVKSVTVNHYQLVYTIAFFLSLTIK